MEEKIGNTYNQNHTTYMKFSKSKYTHTHTHILKIYNCFITSYIISWEIVSFYKLQEALLTLSIGRHWQQVEGFLSEFH